MKLGLTVSLKTKNFWKYLDVLSFAPILTSIVNSMCTANQKKVFYLLVNEGCESLTFHHIISPCFVRVVCYYEDVALPMHRFSLCYVYLNLGEVTLVD